MTDAEVIGGSRTDARYDRQIRLWGKDGQQALQEANIIALGATVAVTEALKSVILTGVRSVTLVDERRVSRRDIAHNFFLSTTDDGASLAECVVRQLGELNRGCAGLAVGNMTPAEWVDALVDAVTISDGDNEEGKRPGTAASLRRVSDVVMHAATPVVNADVVCQDVARLPSLILASNRYADWSSVSPLVRVAANVLRIPVVVVESRGLTGYLQTFAHDRVVVRPFPQPDQLVEDLRIFEPFPALQAWFDAHDPEDTTLFAHNEPDSLNAHSHLPYPCLIYHAYRRYQSRLRKERGRGEEGEEGSATPATPHRHDDSEDSHCALRSATELPTWPLQKADFEALKEELRGMRRRENPPQEGFQEALENCYTRLNRPLTLPASVEALFADPRTRDPTLLFHQPTWRAPLPLGEPQMTPPCSPSGGTDRSCSEPDGEGAVSEPQKEAEGCASRALSLAPLPDNEFLLSWFVLHAIKAFYEDSDAQGGGVAADERAAQPRHRVLPLCGHVPDFTTLTPWFQELRGIYRAKHEADCADVSRRVRAHLSQVLEQAEQQLDVSTFMGDVRDADADMEAHRRVRETEARFPVGTRFARFYHSLTEESTTRLAKDLVSNIWYACALSFSPGFLVDQTSNNTASQDGPRGVDGVFTGENTAHAAWTRVLRRQMRKALQAFVELGQWGFGEDSKRACGVGLALCAVHEMQRRDARSTPPPPQDTEEETVQHVPGEAADRLFTFLTQLVDGEADGHHDGQGGGASLRTATAEDAALLARLCTEVERVGRAEMPSVAAVIGALAAQETIKLVQRGRVPTTYPMVYSGIDGVFHNLPGTA